MINKNNSLSEKNLNSFFSEGYLRLPDLISPPLLDKLRALFDELMSDEANAEDTVVKVIDGKRFVSNIDKLFGKGNLACLELLGFPPILEIAEKICGEDFFLIQEFAVIKMLGSDEKVAWHQDMLHERTGNCFTMGIYLDDARENDGALHIVPQSHLSGKDICELQKEDFIEVEMNAGDVLIHDMMLAHSSEILTEIPVRRVIYFEFLSVSQVLREKIYSEETLDLRMRLLNLAINYYRKKNPENTRFDWKNPAAADFDFTEDSFNELKEIIQKTVHAKPSAYCFENLF